VGSPVRESDVWGIASLALCAIAAAGADTFVGSAPPGEFGALACKRAVPGGEGSGCLQRRPTFTPGAAGFSSSGRDGPASRCWRSRILSASRGFTGGRDGGCPASRSVPGAATPDVSLAPSPVPNNLQSSVAFRTKETKTMAAMASPPNRHGIVVSPCGMSALLKATSTLRIRGATEPRSLLLIPLETC